MRQHGATLVELLISLVIGLIITASMLGMYVTSTANSSQILKSSKLNQELTTLMTVMTNDIRRAGFNGNNISDPADNIFSNPGENGLLVAAGNDCILYAYDADVNGDATNQDLRGFRYQQNAGGVGYVQMLDLTKPVDPAQFTDDTYCTAGDDADLDGNADWKALTDPNTVDITTLAFQLKDGDDTTFLTTESSCLNTDQKTDCTPYLHKYISGGSALANGDTTAPGDEDVILVTYQVDISLTGVLRTDSSTKVTVGTESSPVTVKVRNDQAWEGKLP